MNRQELIKRIKDLPFSYIWNEPYLNKEVVLDMIKQLDEPEKVTIPQFIADKIEYARKYDYTIFDAMMMTKRDDKFYDWVFADDNMETFTLAWQHGYEVEEEKRYSVKVKGVCGNHETLNCEKHSKKWLFSDREENSLYKTEHTRKELEEAGFGEVFNSPLFEVEEV